MNLPSSLDSPSNDGHTTGSPRALPAGAPLAVWGLWALLRTAIDDDGGRARGELRQSAAGQRGVNAAAVLHADAIAAGRAGKAAEAVELLARAEPLLADAPWWARLLRLLVHEAALTDGWGSPLEGLRADLTGFEAAGDRSLARTCRDLLRTGGVTVRRGRGDSLVPPRLAARGVTSREMDVLQLVAQGASNPDVAARLHLSPRTVENHVARLLAKAGASSRAELRVWSRSADSQ